MSRRTAVTGSGGKPRATAEATEWLVLVDNLYRTGGQEDAVASWLSELATVLGAASCALQVGGDEGQWLGADPAGEVRGERVNLGGDPDLALVFDRDRRLTAAEKALLGSLRPHLERTFTTQPAIPSIDQALLPAALDRLSLGVLVIGSGGELLHANRAANRVLDSANGLSREGKGVRLASASAESALVALRSSPLGDQRSRPAARLLIPRDSGAPLEVLAVSLEGLGVDDRSAVALFVSDQEIGVGTPPSVLRELYGLSRREADVVEQILLGRPLDEAATALGIHLETVRMHLKQVFQKVGTRRQVDLVRLLLTGVSSLHWE